jgi:ATP-dependent DNA helicase DinG
VTWIDARDASGSDAGSSVRPARARAVAFGASPVDLGDVFRQQIFDRVGAVILTSASLATAAPRRKAAGANPPRSEALVPMGTPLSPIARRSGPHTPAADFGFLRSRIGLDGDDDLGVLELAVPSPFDYGGRALLYTPDDLPMPFDPAFVISAAAKVGDLCSITGGGAFVLCTSNRAMRAFADALRGRLPMRTLVQGEAPKSALLDRFRGDGDAVLVATMSFWEGVDVPGDALRLVVIEKLPFEVPTDPIAVARCGAIEQRGDNPFTAYSVPKSAILLKQGFGRLLRTRADRGVVAILDGRVRTRGYGKVLLQSLPPAPRTDRLDDVRAFWEKVGRA